MPTLAIENAAAVFLSPPPPSMQGISTSGYGTRSGLIAAHLKATQVGFFVPFWQVGENLFANRWLGLKPELETDPVNCSFWIYFYDDALVGRNQNWPLLH